MQCQRRRTTRGWLRSREHRIFPQGLSKALFLHRGTGNPPNRLLLWSVLMTEDELLAAAPAIEEAIQRNFQRVVDELPHLIMWAIARDNPELYADLVEDE